MSLVAGLDFSTHAIDVVLLDEDGHGARHDRLPLDTGPGDGIARVRRIRDGMPARGRWRDEGVLAVAIEKPMGRAGRGADTLQYALGAILACLPPTMRVELIRADDWRRACGLPLRADRDVHKANAIRFAGERWQNAPERLGDNAADAFCIAWALRAVMAAEKETAAA